METKGIKIKCVYSKEDKEWVATCKEKYPHLSWLSITKERAIKGFKKLLKEIEKEKTNE